jgi:hypothetical protein
MYETQLWLELLRDDCKTESADIETLWREADDLISVFVTMSKNTRNKK